MFRKPVYGEDCRKAVKINLLFGDVFEVKRHKNIDRYNKQDISSINDLERASSTIFNPFSQSLIFNSD